MLEFRQIPLYCLGYRLSKHKMAVCSENWGVMAPRPPLAKPMSPNQDGTKQNCRYNHNTMTSGPHSRGHSQQDMPRHSFVGILDTWPNQRRWDLLIQRNDSTFRALLMSHIHAGAGTFLRLRKIFARISPNLPEKFWCNFCLQIFCHKDHEDLLLV